MPVVIHLLNPGRGPEGDEPPSCGVGLSDAIASYNHATGGEIGAFNMRHQILESHIVWGMPMINEMDNGVADLVKVMRGDVRRHAHGDTGRSVDQQVGETSW